MQRKSGLEDAIIDEHNGILVNPSKEAEIIKSLKNILINYETYSNRSKSHAINNNWSTKVSKYENCIPKIKNLYNYF